MDGGRSDRPPPVVSASVLREQKREMQEPPPPLQPSEGLPPARRAFATLCLCPATEEPISRAGLSKQNAGCFPTVPERRVSPGAEGLLQGGGSRLS